MKIALIGDIALFGCNKRNSKYQEKFRSIKEYLSTFDFVIGNLETPLTEETRVIGGKSAYIKGNPADSEILKYLGITHVSLANNHIFDFGEKGLKETIDVLNNIGIYWYGIQGKTVEIVKQNTKLKLHGYCCYSTNGKGMRNYVDVFNPIKVEEDILADQQESALSILSIHWGQEHVHYPNYDHVLTARKLASKAPFIIHGHHPHVLQGWETVARSLIAYSLGNFCFDDVYTNKSKEPLIKLSDDNREAIVFEVEINENKIENTKIKIFTFDEKMYHEAFFFEEKEKQWNEFLNEDEGKYREVRQKQISAYIDGRKNKRNLQWYLKRINMESVHMIMDIRNNQKNYETLIRNYIKGNKLL